MNAWTVGIIISLSIVRFAWAQPDTVWTQHYGGSDEEVCRSVVNTLDSGYALLGQTMTFAVGGRDYWLVKTNPVGGEQWNRTYGGTGEDFGYSIVQTADSGFVLAGASNSQAGNYNAWIVRTNSIGDTLWTRSMGGSARDECYAVVQTEDDGFACAGYTTSTGSGNFWLFKLSPDGDSLWSRHYGGIGLEICRSLVATPDGGFLLAGQTQSYGIGYANAPNYWVLRTDANGDSLWSRVFDGTGTDVCMSAAMMPDSGFIFGGYSQSHSAGLEDGWLIRTDANGDTLWSRNFGTSRSDYCYAVAADRIGNVVAAGWATTGSGYDNYWLFSTDIGGGLRWDRTIGGQSPDQCNAVLVEGDTMFVMAGGSYSFTNGGQDFWLVKTRAREPLIQVVPASVDFSTVQVGGVGARNVTILNPGDVNVNITGITVPEHFGTDLTPPFTVAPGGEQIMTIVFIPDSVGPFGGMLTLHSNARSGDSTVTLTGVGVPDAQYPEIDVEPDQVVFGDVPIGTYRYHIVILGNIGSSALTVTDISVPNGYSTDFAGNLTLQPNQHYQVIVTFTPLAQVIYDGSLVVHSTATLGDSIIVLIGEGILDAEDIPAALPTEYRLAVYPNPFNSQTVISYALPRAEAAQILVHDVTGRVLRTLADEIIPAGEYRVAFDGAGLPGGVYFVTLRTPSFQSTEKLILLK